MPAAGPVPVPAVFVTLFADLSVFLDGIERVPWQQPDTVQCEKFTAKTGSSVRSVDIAS